MMVRVAGNPHDDYSEREWRTRLIRQRRMMRRELERERRARRLHRVVVSVLIVAIVVLSLLLAFRAQAADAAAPEAPVTVAASGVSGTGATLHGELNPNTTASVGWFFEYNTGAGCEGGGSSPVQAEVTGTKLKVAEGVVLEASTEYAFCVVARHEENGEAEQTAGGVLKFKTLASAPVVVSEAVSGVTPVSATVEGRVNTENEASTYVFEYSKSPTLASGVTSVGEAGLPGNSEPEQGAGPVGLSGLESSTDYYFRVSAKNATGTTHGKIEKFTTEPAKAPTITAERVEGVGQTGASLFATIDPEYQNTTFQFDLGLTPGYGLSVPASPEQMGGEGSGGESEVSYPTGGEGLVLAPNTEYHYQAVAANGTGTVEGHTAVGDQTFLTLPLDPFAETKGSTVTSPTSAQVSGVVDPENEGQPAQDATSYYFEYGHTTSYGARTPVASAGEGEEPVEETATLGALEPGTTYHYRFVAANNNNRPYGTQPQTAYGTDHTFEIPPTLPKLENVAVGAVTQTTATITADLDTAHLPTHYELEVAANAELLTPAQQGTATSGLALSLTADGLSAGTLYHYELIATNADGTVKESGTFQTLASPAETQASLPATIAYTPMSTLALEESKIPLDTTPSTQTPLEKALASCHKKHNRRKRTACEHQARKHHKHT
jgi:hypothetical protein